MDRPVTVVIANGTNHNAAVAKKGRICAVVSIFVIFVLFSVPILALIMGTGRIWKCPGEPKALSWLLGYGIIGIMCCWFLIVMIVQHITCGGIHDRSVRKGVKYILISIFLVLIGVWSFVSFFLLRFTSVTTYPYYIKGQNMYCHPLIEQFSTVVRWISPFYIVISMCFGAGAVHRLSKD